MCAPRAVLRRLVLVPAVAAATVLLAAPSATADAWHTGDPRDRSLHGYGDIRRAEVAAQPHFIRLRVRVQRFQAFDTIWHFDTDASSPGPEFYAHRNSDSSPRVISVGRQLYGSRCSRRSVELSDGGRLLTAKFRPRCLADDGVVPSRLRARVVTAEDEFDADCAPGGRRGCGWSRWIRVG